MSELTGRVRYRVYRPWPLAKARVIVQVEAKGRRSNGRSFAPQDYTFWRDATPDDYMPASRELPG
jgi:hypothetical protein